MDILLIIAPHITVIAGVLIKWRFRGWIDWKYHLETIALSIQTHPSRKSHKNPRQSKHFSSFQIHYWTLFLTERSRGVSLVILRMFISSMTVTFITSPRFMPLNFRLDALFWLVCATWQPPVLKFGDGDQLPVAHVVRSVSIIFEFPRGADYQNSDHPYVDNSWLCSLNSFVCHF